MTEFANTQTVALFVNATTRQIQCDGLTKSISDDYWTKEISPVLYPLWDSDRDKLESFIFYKDETSKMLKNKYQRDQKTKAYKWVSYEFDTSEFTAVEIKGLYNTLHDKFINYRDIEDYDLEKIGPEIENHKYFPEKCNVTIAKVINKNLIKVKVWERGAGLTKACGTAACATAFAGKLNNLTSNNTDIEFETGKLSIFIDEKNSIPYPYPLFTLCLCR